MKWDYITFYFGHDFELDDIPDDTIISILDNVENKLLKIGSY